MAFYSSMPLLCFLVLSFILSGYSLWIREETRLEKVGLRAHAQARWASLVNFACILIAQMAKSLPTETFLLLLWCPLPIPSGLCSQFSTHRLLKHHFPRSLSCGHNPLPVVTPFFLFCSGYYIGPEFEAIPLLQRSKRWDYKRVASPPASHFSLKNWASMLTFSHMNNTLFTRTVNLGCTY